MFAYWGRARFATASKAVEFAIEVALPHRSQKCRHAHQLSFESLVIHIETSKIKIYFYFLNFLVFLFLKPINSKW